MSQAGPLVLIVEDEAPVRRFLCTALEAQGYRTVEADTAQAGLAAATTRGADLILLDLGLPDGDGLDVVRRVREWSGVPIIIVTVRDRDDDKVRALDAGADDYLTKPFSAAELLARIRVALRHAAATGSPDGEAALEIGPLRIDQERREVRVGGRAVHLTVHEYRLLTLLARHAGKVMTHRQILGEVWGPPFVDKLQYLRVFVAQLRKKIEADPSRPRLLVTEQGVGYRVTGG
ncbi:MAG: response regulator [Deltaproteobacteria bacterium]|nr:response regulator [Deltaproteobacteria bacterium]